LDLVAVEAIRFAPTAMLVPRLFLGNIDQSPHVKRRRGTRFVIERSGSGYIHTDGETHWAGAQLEVVVRPRSLRIVIPKTSRAVDAMRENVSAQFALRIL
jgi:diacylglycerol kinase (ATP)